MMEILVIGAGCPTCGQLYDNTLKAVKSLGIEAEVKKVEDLMEIVRLGIMTAPSLMVDGKLEISGQTASEKKITEVLKKHI